MIAFPNVPAAQMSGQEQSISVELVGAKPLHLLRKPFPLKSPTGAFVADANAYSALMAVLMRSAAILVFSASPKAVRRK